MTIFRLLTAGLMVACSACATTGTSGTSSKQAVAKPMAQSSQALGTVVNAQLPDKSCGMILWTLDEQRPTPVFRYVSGKEADIVIAETPTRLSRLDYAGSSGFGVFENQIFGNDDGMRVEVTAKFGLGFDGGSYLERGLIKVITPDGWSIVAPAAGIAGCRS